MATTSAHELQPRGENRFLAVLPSDVRARLGEDLDPVRLGFRELVHESDQAASYVYFPLDGVLSVLTILEDKGPVEVATVGNEGFLGLPILLGGDSAPGRAFCQIPGEALRARAAVFRKHVDREPALRRVLLRYAQAYLLAE